MEIMFITIGMKLALLASSVTIFLLIRYAVKRKKLVPGNKEFRTPGEVTSKALVLSAEKTVHFVNNTTLVKLQLQVTPERGRNFVVDLKQAFSPADAGSIHTGSTIIVKYNPANMKEISLIKASEKL